MCSIEFSSKKEGLISKWFSKYANEEHEQMKGYPEDGLVLLTGRSRRPEPRRNYTAIWKIGRFGPFDEWRQFVSDRNEIEKGARFIELARI